MDNESENRNLEVNTEAEQIAPTNSKLISWLKKIGVLGFLFFLIKGIAWLVVIYLGQDWFKKFFNN